ncbi:MAG: PspC domain-containing protein [Kosmotogaceae bacterium]
MKRLYKSRKEKMIDGVCGGIAEYANVDPTIIRLIFFLLIFAGGAGIILYLIAMIIMPRKPIKEDETVHEEVTEENTEEGKKERVSPESSKIILAAIIIVIGIFLLLNAFLPAGWFTLSWKILLGIILVAGGGIIIYRSFEKE